MKPVFGITQKSQVGSKIGKARIRPRTKGDSELFGVCSIDVPEDIDVKKAID